MQYANSKFSMLIEKNMKRPISQLHLLTVILLIVGTMLYMKGHPPGHGAYTRCSSTSSEYVCSVKGVLLNRIEYDYICCNTDFAVTVHFRFQTLIRSIYDSKDIVQFK